MKKQVITVTEKHFHKINQTIGPIAILESEEGAHALQNLSDGRLITPFERCTVAVDDKKGLIFLESTCKENQRAEYKTISIYDAVHKKMMCEHATIIETLTPKEQLILRTSNPTKLRIFDKRDYDLFAETFDGYQKINIGKNCFLIMTQNSLQGLYSLAHGSLTTIDSQKIRAENDRIIIRKNGQEKCLLLPASSTDLFERIRVDKGMPNIIYCYKDGYIYVYAIYQKGADILHNERNFNTADRLIPILKTSGDDIEFVAKSIWPTDYRGEYRFLVTKNGKKYIEDVYISSISDFKEVTHTPDETGYDNIYRMDGTYYVEKDGKVGILQHPTVPPVYDKIVSYPDKIYALYKGDYCDIVRMNITLSILAEHCKILEYRPGGFILETDAGPALLIYHRDFSEITHCPTIEHLAEEYYILGDAGHKALYRRGLRLTTDDNLDIKIHGDSSTGPDLHHRGRLYIAMKKENGYSLIISEHNPNGNPLNITGNPKSYENIEFFADFIMIRTSNEVILNSYGYISFHATYPYDTEIRVTGHCGDSPSNGLIYTINGVDHIYYFDTTSKMGALVNVATKSHPLHMAAYESDFGTVVVNSYDEQTFANTCASIDSLSEEEFSKTLKTYYDEHADIEERYPKLRLTPIKK